MILKYHGTFNFGAEVSLTDKIKRSCKRLFEGVVGKREEEAQEPKPALFGESNMTLSGSYEISAELNKEDMQMIFEEVRKNDETLEAGFYRFCNKMTTGAAKFADALKTSGREIQDAVNEITAVQSKFDHEQNMQYRRNHAEERKLDKELSKSDND